MPRGGYGRGPGGIFDPKGRTGLGGLAGAGLGLGPKGQCQLLYGDVLSNADKELQKKVLLNRASVLQAELDMINNRLKEMEAT